MTVKEEMDGIDVDDIVGILKYPLIVESLLEILRKADSWKHLELQ